MNGDEENDFRFERKFHIQEVSTAEVIHWVMRSPALFREAFHERAINNIYLDTPGLASYFENVSGIADRTKMRIRWYGNLLGPVRRPVLEYKIKRGAVGTKDAYPMRPFTVERGFGIDDLRPVMQDPALPESVRIALSHVEPALINRYRRRYFISADHQYRITVDWGLEFYRVHRHDNQFLSRMQLTGSSVMELKYSGDLLALDDHITNFFPFRVTRMSKYVTGLEGVEG